MFWKILDFVKEFDREHGPFKRVLDVGSRNVNGSVKDVMLNLEEFIGTDMIDGKDVDIVMNAHYLLDEFLPQNFDLVICCETLEHDDYFWLTVENMRELVKPGGYLLITVPGINFFKHDWPSDYYRFTEEVYKDFFFRGWEDIHIENYTDAHSEYENKPNNLMGYARKPK